MAKLETSVMMPRVSERWFSGSSMRVLISSKTGCNQEVCKGENVRIH
jgi:hypothetical protein